jgi:hypothetical protein
MYETLANGAEPQIRGEWRTWLGFGALVSIGGPLIGALLALASRRRNPHGKLELRGQGTTQERFSRGDKI